MNGKDIYGLIDLLRKKRDFAIALRNVYEESKYKVEGDEEKIAELGVEISEYNYYIRLFEESEVTLR